MPDERLDKLSALYSPKKTTFATVEYVDVAAIGYYHFAQGTVAGVATLISRTGPTGVEGKLTEDL